MVITAIAVSQMSETNTHVELYVCEVNQQSLYRCCRCCLLGGVRVGGGKTYNCIHHSFKGFYVSATISCLKVSTFKPTSLDVLKSALE